MVDGFGGFVFVDDGIATQGSIVVTGAVHDEHVDDGNIAGFGGEHDVFAIGNVIAGDGMAFFQRRVFTFQVATG